MSTYYLAHHGILGQKWGIRRYQNTDGSLTAKGYARSLNKLEKQKIKIENSKFRSTKRYETKSAEVEKSINELVSNATSSGMTVSKASKTYNLNNAANYTNAALKTAGGLALAPILKVHAVTTPSRVKKYLNQKKVEGYKYKVKEGDN